MADTNALAPNNVNALAQSAAPAYSAITDLSKYKSLTSNNPTLTADFKPLNFDALLKAGAFRVTHRGLDNGYDPNPSSGFSLVSAFNDAYGPGTRAWKNNPTAHNVVKEMFTQRPEDIGPHKYLQILQSARDLGIPDAQIFLPSTKQ